MSKRIPDAEDLAFLNHEARLKMLFMRDRGMDRMHEPYNVEQFKNHFAPYLLLMDHEGLSPREVRLIETVLWAWGEIIEITQHTRLARAPGEGPAAGPVGCSGGSDEERGGGQ